VLKLFSVHKQIALQKDLKLIFEASETLPKHIMSDSSRISQVLINLIANAIKFTSAGHVKVEIDYERDPKSVPTEF
jgi:signal transduction histidine kinase